MSERCYSALQRRIQLSTNIDSNGIKAKFKNGVLTVRLTKDEKIPARAHKIAEEKV